MTSLPLFLCLVVMGAAVQTLTGFAMGLLIMGGVTLLGVAPVAFTAAVVSLLSLANTAVALSRSWRRIDLTLLVPVAAGMLPGLVLGVLLLEAMSAESGLLVRRLLGAIIIAAGVVMTLKPTPWSQPSPWWMKLAFGHAGGLLGGLFSTSGPPLAYLMYRQPVEFQVVRATLLATFAISTLGRTLTLAGTGGLSRDMLVVSATAVPLVLGTTVFVGRLVPAGAAEGMRRFVFALLILIGLSLLGGG